MRRSTPYEDHRSIVVPAAVDARHDDGLRAIELLLADPSVSEVMVNGPGPVFVDRHGRSEASGFAVSMPAITVLIERLLDPLGLQIDRTTPLVDARLPDGSRVNVAVAPAAPSGPLVTIRRFADRPLPLAAFGDPSVVALLGDLLARRRSLLVVGGTSSGKTSLLGALGSLLPPGERVITIEDTAELRLDGGQVVSLEARLPNREGAGEVTMRDLVRNALRMRPDRLIVGEVRGAEALDLLLALNAGHEGSMATCHANDAGGALVRLEVLARLAGADVPSEALRALAVGAFDVVVHVARRGARRVVTEVLEPGDGRSEPRTLWAIGSRRAA
ncbi:MAG: ATPase, T2SS/T4P/T4SS family [Actinomycetota bacterium]